MKSAHRSEVFVVKKDQRRNRRREGIEAFLGSIETSVLTSDLQKLVVRVYVDLRKIKPD